MAQPARHCAWIHARWTVPVPHLAELHRKDTNDGPTAPDPVDTDAALDAQAAAFAQLLGRSPDDLDDAWRQATALADGLFPHQVEGVAFLLGRRRAILADDMGLGKTRQAIVSLRHASPDGPFLVVCPASVKRNWAREIAAVAPTASVLRARRRHRRAGTLSRNGRSSTTTSSARHLEALGRATWAGIVFDEAHYLKNHTSARSRIARQLVDRATTRATTGGRGSRRCIC